jgi:hypothetical protein
MVIILVAIDSYYINGYQWILYWWSLMVIILVAINSYSINGY